jgi:hypothetical protein
MTGRHRRAIRRQKIAKKRAITLVTIMVMIALSAGGFELADHGWSFFVDRPPGVGATVDVQTGD